MLREGYRKAFQVAGRQLLLMEEGGQRFLLENRCPHAGSPLHEATFQDGNLRCPLHGLCFNLTSGNAVNVERFSTDKKLIFFNLIYRDKVVGVEL